MTMLPVPFTSLDATFVALADPVRRSVVVRLSRGPTSVGVLAGEHPMSLPGFLKHLRILEAAGIVATRKVGRVRECALMTAPLSEAGNWIEQHKAFWEQQLSALERFFSTDLKQEDTLWPRPPQVPSDSSSTAKSRRPRSKSSTRGRKPRK